MNRKVCLLKDFIRNYQKRPFFKKVAYSLGKLVAKKR